MKKILFITDRNILTTSGELRLIRNRAESLFNEAGIITDFIVFAKRTRIEKKNEDINAGGTIEAKEISLSKPLATFKAYFDVRKEISNRIKTNEYRAVILSGPIMISYAKKIKKGLHVPVIADIHGSFEDMVAFGKNSSFAKRAALYTAYNLERLLLSKNSKYTDGFFVVTEALERYIKENYNPHSGSKFFIIPCATDTQCFIPCEHTDDRRRYREKYGIGNDEIVFIYSGGVSSWQCVDKTIELYKRIADILKNKSRMLVFSHRKEEIQKIAGDDSRIQIDSYPPEELVHVLHAGDFAFLLREDNITNNVAFPNKYLEYVQSGMRIITTPYVKEIAKQVSQYGLGYLYDFSEDIQPLVDYIQNVGIDPCKEEIINKVLKMNGFTETTREFCRWFELDNKPN